MDLIATTLLNDLDRLASRVNSEEGIPMFLACEDLSSPGAAGTSNNMAPQELNGAFVSTFLNDVEFVQNARPDAPLTDIAKIVERLAEQDFAFPGPEQFP